MFRELVEEVCSDKSVTGIDTQLSQTLEGGIHRGCAKEMFSKG